MKTAWAVAAVLAAGPVAAGDLPPLPGYHSVVLAKGGLAVENDSGPVGGAAPRWAIAATGGMPVSFQFTDNAAHTTQPLSDNIYITDVGGHPALGIMTGYGYCFGDLDGMPATIGPQPKTFKLSHFRLNTQPEGPCVSSDGQLRDHAGEVTLKATAGGNLIMDLRIETLNPDGSVLHDYVTTGFVIANMARPQ